MESCDDRLSFFRRGVPFCLAEVKILIVEDEKIVAKDISLSLQKLGFGIAGIAHNGEDAIKLASETNPSAILMDIKLAGDWDGIETASKLNEKFNIPVIYLTALHDEQTIEKSKITKPYGYLLKPLNDRDLNACLRMALFKYDSEKKLRESDERYFRLTENARDMIYKVSLVNGVYEYVNRASIEITGYTPHDFYTNPKLLEKITHPDWKHYFKVMQEKLKMGDVPDIYEYQIIHKNGETRWLNQRNVLLKDEVGLPAALEGIVTDITDRKKNDALIRKQNDEYRLILDSMPAMVMVKDNHNKLLKVNRLAAQRKGVKAEDMEGRYSEEFFVEQSEMSLKAEREILISGKPWLNSVEIFTNGTTEKKWAKVDRFPYRNEKGEIGGIIVFAQDITEQKKAEDELHKIERKDTAILNSLPDLIFMLDSNGTVLEHKINNNPEIDINYSEFTGKNVSEILPPEEAKNIIHIIKKSLETDKTQIYEYSREIKNTVKEFEIRFVPTDDNEVIAMLRDITERKQFVHALKESESRYRNLTDNAPICLTRLLVKERIYEFANDEFVRQSGFTLEEFNKLTDAELNELIHPDDMERVLSEYDQWAKDSCPGVKRITYRFKNKTGNMLWLDTYHYADYDFHGKIYAINQIYIDITEQKKSEDALRVSEEKFRTVADTAHAVIFIFQENNFVYGNAYAEILTEYTLDELLKMNFWDIVHPDFRDEAKARGFARQRGEVVSSRNELKIVTKSGKEKWIDLSVSLFEYEDKPAVIGTAIDITESKYANELLKLNEEKFRAVAESMPAQIVIFQGEKFIYANPYTETLTGYKPKEILNMNFWELVHPESREKVKSFGLARQRGERVPESYEMKIITKPGEEKWLQYSARMINYNNKPAVLGTSIDITQRKAAEEHLRESRERYKTFIDQSAEGIYRDEIKNPISTELPVERQIELLFENAYIAECNKVMAQMYKIDNPAELIGKKLDEMLIKDDHVNSEFLRSFIMNGYCVTDEETHETDIYGEEIIFSNNAIGIVENGMLVRIWGTQRDITKRKKTEEKIRENTEYSRIINYFTASLIHQNTIEEILWDVSKNCFSSLSFVDCVIYLVDDTGKMLIQKAAYGRKNPSGYEILNPKNIPLGKGIAGAVALTGVPEIIPDTSSDSRYIVDDEIRLSEIAVPIINEGKVIGVIDSEHPEKGFFKEFHLNILMSIASLCSNKIVRAIAEDKIRQSEIKYKTLVNGMNEGVIYTNNDDIIQFANDQFCRMFGYARKELLGKTASEIFLDNEQKEILKEKIESRKQGISERYEIKMKNKTGEQRWILISGSPVLDGDGNIIGSVGTHADITERKLAEERLKSSLAEKEILLKEIHHRVKNNLQIVSSLLKLQATYINDPAALDLFKESRNRVQSMALIHQKLYQARDLTNIDFCEYAGNLISYLMQTFGLTKEQLKMNINADKVLMSIDNAIPAGLIINELVTNSIKHGFRNKTDGVIDINIRFDATSKEYTMSVKDNGCGFPAEIDIYKSPSFGLKLVTTLAEQMKGNVTLLRNGAVNGNGTEFVITMKNADYRERS